MQLYTDRLCLRPVTEADAEELFRIYGDPATNTFNPAGPYPDIRYAREVLAGWLEHWQQQGFGDWAISHREEPEKIIGFGGLKIKRAGDTVINNLGYRFDTRAWGKGYATELARFAVDYGFTRLNLREICAVVRPQHQASRKVLEKAGLVYSKAIHDVENAPPSLLYALSVEEWRNRQR